MSNQARDYFEDAFWQIKKEGKTISVSYAVENIKDLGYEVDEAQVEELCNAFSYDGELDSEAFINACLKLGLDQYVN